MPNYRRGVLRGTLNSPDRASTEEGVLRAITCLQRGACASEGDRARPTTRGGGEMVEMRTPLYCTMEGRRNMHVHIECTFFCIQDTKKFLQMYSMLKNMNLRIVSPLKIMICGTQIFRLQRQKNLFTQAGLSGILKKIMLFFCYRNTDILSTSAFGDWLLVVYCCSFVEFAKIRINYAVQA